MGRLIDADKLLKQPIDTAHYPSNFVKHAPTVEAIPKDKVKQTREEIQKLVDMCGSDTVADFNMKSGLGLALEKIDKLIESEYKDA